MSERVKVELPKRDRELLERLCKETGLTAEQGLEMALLCFFSKRDPELFEEIKRIVDPAVLREYEKNPP